LRDDEEDKEDKEDFLTDGERTEIIVWFVWFYFALLWLL
jgi:hypothetical protein